MTLRLDPDVARDLRIEAAKRNIRMADLATDALRRYFAALDAEPENRTDNHAA